MSGEPRLRVLFTPSPRDGAWRQGIIDAATAKGWTVADFGADPADVVIAIQIPPERMLELEPRDWVILADTPGLALATYGSALQETPPGAQALSCASVRLSCAAWLAERGAAVLGMPAAALGLPGLGMVSPAPYIMPAVDPGPAGPALAMYDRLPVPVGARAVWEVDRFSFPIGETNDGGTARIDMTGRARVVMHGPYVELPPGLWRATVKFMVDPEGGHPPLRFEWGVGDDMVSESVSIDRAGFYSLALDRVWETPGFAQVRILIYQAVFQGRLEFLDCVVERLPDPEPQLNLA